ncbi:MAG: glycosyltransferase family 9 protein [Thermoanaerobaculia bacterium]|nr:glycosyltransferase family 9 protein [Thermoanaerobaculia bacterium]
MKNQPKIEAERICLLRLGAFGDTFHALSMVNGLRRLYPDAHLSWILEPVPGEIVREQTTIDELIVVRPGNRAVDWLEVYGELRRRDEFDLLIVPQVSFRSSLIASLVDARTKLGFDWNRSREGHWLFVNRHLPPGTIRHAQDLFLEFLEFLGLESYEPEWNLRFTPEEKEQEREFFSSIGAPVLALVVASSAPAKDWPVEHYAEVADRAREEFGLVPMLVGGPSSREEEIATAIASRMESDPVVALDKPVREMLWKLHGSRIVVAPDTGPLHAAVAMNRPTIGLYGYSNPRRCGPYGRFQDLLIDAYTDPGEESVISRETKGDRMRRITPDMVIEKIEVVLNRS